MGCSASIAPNQGRSCLEEVSLHPFLVAAASAAESVRIEDYSLSELLNLETDIATRTDLPSRETPGLVTVLTGEELVRLGARDLLDALRLLPVFEPAVDVFGAVGFGVRGSWAFEGRTLLLVDGIEWNELEWSTTSPMANRLPAWLIERVEVIRGPGSAVYGGTAELAVVKVTTLGGSDWEGVKAQGRYTWLPSWAAGRRDLGLALARPLGEARVAVTAHLGDGRASDATYLDAFGNAVDMTDSFATDSAIVDGRVELGAVSMGGGYNRYAQTQQDGYDRALRRPVDAITELGYAWAQAELPLGSQGSLLPRLSWTWSQPWTSRRGLRPTHFMYAHQWAHRVRGSLIGQLQASERVALLAGTELTWDRGELGKDLPDFWSFSDGQRHEDYANGALFGQLVGHAPWATVTAGVRVDAHTIYGAAIAPRLALTRTWERAHLKLIASRAFRAPGVSLLRDEVGPEIAHSAEAELGGGLGDSLYVTGSAWATQILSPLLYVYAENAEGVTQDGFANGEDRTGTAGGELELRAALDRAELVMGYGGWVPLNEIDYFAVPGRPDRVLGLPQHKLVARGAIELGRHLSLGPTATWIAPRWAVTRAGGAGAELLPAAILLDLSVGLQEGPWRLSLTGHDLLDSNPGFAQPYDGDHAPLPGPGRELGLQLTFQHP